MCLALVVHLYFGQPSSGARNCRCMYMHVCIALWCFCVLSVFFFVVTALLPLSLGMVHYNACYLWWGGGKKGCYGFTNKLSPCMSENSLFWVKHHCFGISLIGERLIFDYVAWRVLCILAWMQVLLYLEDDVSMLLGFCMGVSAFLPEGEGISDPFLC